MSYYNQTDSEAMAMDDSDARARARAHVKSPAKKKSWPQRRAYLSAWNSLCARMGWDADDDVKRKALRADVLAVLGEEQKPFDDLTPVQFGVVLWVFNTMAPDVTPTVEQILERAEWERRHNYAWKIRKAIGRYDPDSAWTVLKSRFKIFFVEQLDELEKREVEGPNGLREMLSTFTDRTYEPRT